MCFQLFLVYISSFQTVLEFTSSPATEVVQQLHVFAQKFGAVG